MINKKYGNMDKSLASQYLDHFKRMNNEVEELDRHILIIVQSKHKRM